MNRDDIIDWVTQVDSAFLKRTEPWNMFDKYEAFAKLVAEHEREACAKLCEEKGKDAYNNEDIIYDWCADAIRARGQA